MVQSIQTRHRRPIRSDLTIELMPVDPDQLRRWRLILGKDAEEPLHSFGASGCGLSAEDLLMDEALQVIYGGDESDEISLRKTQRIRSSQY